MGLWWAVIPRENWEREEGLMPDEQPDWHPRFGDRQQQLVFIGQHMDESTIRALLDACLLVLDDETADLASDAWQGWVNPFPLPDFV